jgi:hypothetical protein
LRLHTEPPQYELVDFQPPYSRSPYDDTADNEHAERKRAKGKRAQRERAHRQGVLLCRNDLGVHTGKRLQFSCRPRNSAAAGVPDAIFAYLQPISAIRAKVQSLWSMKGGV